MIDIRDFGPIREGKISLKPMTVFVGPNNSGKSYAAVLIHSILSALFSTSEPPPEGSPAYAGYDRYIRTALNSKRMRSQISSEDVDLAVKKILANAMDGVLLQELRRNFSPDLKTLVKKNSRSFSVRVDSSMVKSRITSNGATTKVSTTARLPGDDDVAYEPHLDAKTRRLLSKFETIVDELAAHAHDLPSRELATRRIYARAAFRLAPRAVGPSLYLPSSRTGMLQGHKAIYAGVVRSAPSVGIRKLEVPSLSGVVADFIHDLLMLPGQKQRFTDIADDMESELAGDKISVDYGPEKMVAEIKYGDLPMRASSSAVSELAPLILYVRHVLRAGNVLIIEEPEVHLHPANQRLLARFLARLVKRGVNIVVTTHSPFILEQLSHLVRASDMRTSERARNLGYEDCLRADDVAAYVFDLDSRGSRITPIRVSALDGIPQDEFVKVDEAMYGEFQKIENLAS